MIPDPEVPAIAERRQIPATYKARIVREVRDCTEPGAIGALLRREGLYSSQLSNWREQYHTGALQAFRDDKRGRKSARHPLEDENEKLRKQNERLARAEMIIVFLIKLNYTGDSPEQRRERRHEMRGAVKEHGSLLCVAPLCEALGVSRATVYRTWHK